MSNAMEPVKLAAHRAREGEANEFRKQAKPSVVTTKITKPKIGRNEPCPRGSGKKFKKCCGG